MAHFLPCVLALWMIVGLSDVDKDDPKFEISASEQRILDLTNEARAKENLALLKPNATLFKVARAHSSNMAKQGEMKHELDGKNPRQRVDGAGYESSWVGENIAAGEGWSVSAVFQAWMDSKDHKKNILGEKFDEIGLGLARDDKGMVYYTQVFGKANKKP